MIVRRMTPIVLARASTRLVKLRARASERAWSIAPAKELN